MERAKSRGKVATSRSTNNLLFFRRQRLHYGCSYVGLGDSITFEGKCCVNVLQNILCSLKRMGVFTQKRY